MKKQDNNKEKKKNINISKILSLIALLESISYLAYIIIKTDNLVTNITTLSVPLLIAIISLAIFTSSIKSKDNNKGYSVISIIIILFVAFYFMLNIGFLKLPTEKTIGNYENTSFSEFKEFADKNSIELELVYEYSDTIEEGNIIRIDVSADTYIKDIDKITVTISEGPDYDKLITIPSMIGWTVDEVVTYINENFLNNVIIDFEISDEEIDTIISQSINGEIRRNEELTFKASLGSESTEKDIEVIDLINKKEFDALLWLKRNAINYEIKYEFSDTVSSGLVIDQSIKDQTINTKNDKITITISEGKAITIPDFTTMTSKEATDWILNNSLKVKFDDAYDSEKETGSIISQSIAANEQVKANTLVTLTISKGQIKMENFDSLSAFRTWANKYNISYKETYEYSNTVSKGGVISYSYNAGDIVDPDGVITVKLSLGKAVEIPSFIGKTKTDAQKLCNSLGIKCSFTEGDYNSSYSANSVYKQSRSVGTKVTSGSTLTLTLSKGAPSTLTVRLQSEWYIYGNPTATINNLKENLSKKYPGVTFNYVLKPHNTNSPGTPHPDSPIKSGSQVTQGNTYEIWIVSN